MRTSLSISVRRRATALGHHPAVAFLAVCGLMASMVAFVSFAVPASAAGSTCGATINPVTCENSQTSGVTPQSTWDVDGAGDDTIQGFGTDISVNAGSSISFKVKTVANSYNIDIYRLGYYGGNGARRQAPTINVTNTAKNQPTCLSDQATSLVDCGDWAVSASWSVPSAAVSGVYIARLTRPDTGGASLIPFVVRNDASTSSILYQTSDATWEAYNRYGDYDFYTGTQSLIYNSPSRAQAISYNRPFATRDDNEGQNFLFSNEYPTIRFLEENGYDVSYTTDVDSDRRGALIKNHNVFMSVGHDEYWSQGQRTNVEAARDAGVNLMFLSGNEVYWHTRYGPSIDGSATAYRTLICYKETWDNAPTDPTGESTATWRDPRFGNAPGGGNPENSLTGTIFMANTVDLPLTVSKTEAQLRLWRNTSLVNMSGSSTALTAHTVGYESDEDLDNGYRPAGLIDLSTTVGQTAQELTDFGTNVAPATTTHHLTLYRASSGALVFGAGTIQWGWGLDANHDGNDDDLPADPRIQQATVNMLADMHTQPSTLIGTLAPASASTDTQAPTSTITSPSAGTVFANGASVTVTGTAVDAGGGQVAGVEVSIDGGTTWHPATGRTSWSYTGIIHGSGPVAIRSRASDDSVNLETPSAGKTVSVGCPCTLFGSAAPATPDSGDGSAVELGMRFTSDTDGVVSGVRFYKSSANTGTHTGSLWTVGGSALASGTFTGETASGWQTLTFATPVSITAGTTYVVSYSDPNGHYAATANFFYYKTIDAAPLHAEVTSPDGTKFNGVFGDLHTFPAKTYQGTNYWVDPVFVTSASVAPTVVSQTPSPNAGSVATNAAPTATFSKAVDPTSIVFTLTNTTTHAAVSGATTYNSTSKTATFTPTAALDNGIQYAASVTATDLNGNTVSPPATWSFTTAFAGQVGGACPCTLYADTTVPTTVSVNDPSSVELGVKFTADTDGVVTGVRFYKSAQNVGSHTGTLWSATGTQLATGVFSSESSSGWQTLTFNSPVAITAGTTYVASYHTTVGYYSATAGGYTAGVDNFPLHAPASGAVYSYSTGFPTSTSTTDYGVDVVFSVPASVQPTVTASTPQDGSTTVSASTVISATYSTSILGGTATMSVKDGNGATVAGTTALNSVHKVITFSPSAALTAGMSYTVTVNQARSLVGTPQAAPFTWTFSLAGGSTGGTCPCSLFSSASVPATVDSGDTSALSLGTQFVPNANGYISGVRFYKSSANTGTHTGSLWTAAGSRLAQATFTSESSSGWQTVTFATPVAVTAGTTYVVSYYSPNGHYSFDSHFFDAAYSNGPLTVPTGNGVYVYGSDAFPTSTYNNANYWVDVVYNSGAVPTPLQVQSSAPIAAASSVPATVQPSIVFTKAIDPTSLVVTVKDSAGNTVAGTASYDAPSLTATFAPAASLARATTYTVSVTAKTTAGESLGGTTSWTFRTQDPSPAAGVCPCSVWDDTAVPAIITVNDSATTETGVKFTADVAGYVSGLRFYKGPQNTGTHTGSLWSASGTLLATATFTSESSTGWESVSFATPVAITAATTYIVSYKAPAGHYSATTGAFTSAGVDNAPLHVLIHGGAYVYGGGFPTNASDANYWVTPVFQPGAPPADTTPPVISSVSAAASGTGATITWTTDEASDSKVLYGTTSSLGSTASSSGSGTTHSVTLSSLASGTTYYYRVTSADAAGNVATSPVSASAPLTFVSTDTVAPVVSAVTATGTGTNTASVTWTTDEPATSRVDYGTSATALTLSATASGSTTSHTVSLAGLATNTRYYYRVTSADAAGNSTTSPAAASAAASYAPTTTPLVDTTTANFTAGTAASTYTTADGDGGVVLLPNTATDFTATTIPPGWVSTATASGGTTTYGGGLATVKGSNFSTTAAYSSAKSLEVLATLDKNQSIGWAVNATSSTKFAVSVNATNQLIATVNDGFTTNVTSVLATGWTPAAHKFRIEWSSGTVTFYLDDVAKYTRTFSNLLTTSMRPVFSDSVVADAGLLLDWVRVGPYAATGTFTSRVVDASAPVSWDGLTWDATVPTGTTLTVKVRTGNTSTPDGTWSAYATIPASGGLISQTGRYLQYQLTLTSTGTRYVTPTIRSVQAAFHV